MNQRLMCGAVLLGMFVCAATARATNFAVLLSGPPQDPSEQYVVKNPLYQGSGESGQNPLYEPKSLILKPTEVWHGQPGTLQITMDRDLPSGLPEPPANAFVFEVKFIDQNGMPMESFDPPLSFYFDMGDNTQQDWVMGHLDETSGQWKPEPTAVTKTSDGLYCGKTDHLSVFYLAPVPEPSTWALGLMAAAGAGCLVRRRR